MKKYYLSILAIAACLALPITTLAADLTTATSLGNVAFAPSKSVTIAVLANNQSFAATSLHAQGTENYGIISSDTKVYYEVVTAGATIVQPASATALASTTTLTK